jgi:hypothetical protein
MMPAISPTAQTFEIAFKKMSRKSNPRNPAEFAQMHEHWPMPSIGPTAANICGS